MDWYYQRQKVMTIHILAELYMLTDKSVNFTATQEFVDRRVADFREFEKFSNYVRNFRKWKFWLF
jgi:rpsU-divergently transcribed protein